LSLLVCWQFGAFHWARSDKQNAAQFSIAFASEVRPSSFFGAASASQPL
jgi:hypothetical protein